MALVVVAVRLGTGAGAVGDHAATRDASRGRRGKGGRELRGVGVILRLQVQRESHVGDNLKILVRKYLWFKY